MKDIEKYVGYYLLVYLVVLAICGFFQYMTICQGKSLDCAFSMNGINTIITTTAYVITPIVAIIGFFSWKIQKQYDLQKEYAEKILNIINSISTQLNNSYSSFDTLKTLDDKVISLKEFESLNLLNFTNEINSVLTHVKILQQIKNNSEIELIFYNYEESTFKLKVSLDMIAANYKEYYNLLTDELKNIKSSSQFISRDNYDLSVPFILAESKLKRSLEEKIDIYQHHPTAAPIFYSEYLETYKNNFDLNSDIFVKELIQIIKT